MQFLLYKGRVAVAAVQQVVKEQRQFQPGRALFGLGQAGGQVFQPLQQRLRRQLALQNVVEGAVLHGVAHIGKGVEPADHDGLDGRMAALVALFDLRQQFHAVHHRHGHVGDHDLGGGGVQQGEGLPAVFGKTHHQKALVLPGDHVPQDVAKDVLIVHDEHAGKGLQLAFPPFSFWPESAGKVTVTMVPLPGVLQMSRPYCGPYISLRRWSMLFSPTPDIFCWAA